MLGQLTDGMFTMQQSLDQTQPGGIGEKLQNADCLLDMCVIGVFNCMRIHAHMLSPTTSAHNPMSRVPVSVLATRNTTG